MKSLAWFLAGGLSVLGLSASAPAPVGLKQFVTIQPGDTVAMTTGSGLESSCFRAIGNSRLAARPCSAGGFHVFLRVYHGQVIPANATLGDTLALAFPATLATRASACDSAMVAAGIRGDSSIASRPAPCSP